MVVNATVAGADRLGGVVGRMFWFSSDQSVLVLIEEYPQWHVSIEILNQFGKPPPWLRGRCIDKRFQKQIAEPNRIENREWPALRLRRIHTRRLDQTYPIRIETSG